jgi:hypothetical protein
MKTLFTALFFIIISNHAFSAVECETAFGERSFTIERSSVAFHSKGDQGRSISSTIGVMSSKTTNGFRKTVYIDGNKHIIHIEDQSNFNQSEDFLSITNPKGHKMTYPLTCKNT